MLAVTVTRTSPTTAPTALATSACGGMIGLCREQRADARVDQPRRCAEADDRAVERDGEAGDAVIAVEGRLDCGVGDGFGAFETGFGEGGFQHQLGGARSSWLMTRSAISSPEAAMGLPRRPPAGEQLCGFLRGVQTAIGLPPQDMLRVGRREAGDKHQSADKTRHRGALSGGGEDAVEGCGRRRACRRAPPHLR